MDDRPHSGSPLDWRSGLLALTEQRRALPLAASRLEPVRFRYLVDLPPLIAEGRVCLQLVEEKVLRSGITRLRPFPIARALTRPAPEAELPLLARLHSLCLELDGGGQSRAEVLEIPVALAGGLLVEAAATQRLHLVSLTELPPTEALLSLKYRAEVPWEIVLEGQGEAGGCWLRAGLRSEEGRMDAGEPLFCLESGFVGWMNRFSPIVNREAFAALQAWREPRWVPAEEVPDFLLACERVRQVPRICLPEPYAFVERQVVPTPSLKLLAVDAEGHCRMVPEFRYGTVFVDWMNARTHVLDVSQRARFVRNRSEENAALEELGRAGAEMLPGDAEGVWAYDGDAGSALLETLMSQGWELRLRDRPVRGGGRSKLRVRCSGIDWFTLDGEFTVGEETVPLPHLLQAVREQTMFVTLPGGGVALLPEALRVRLGLLEAAAEPRGDAPGWSGASKLWMTLLLEGMRDVDWDGEAAALRERLQQVTTPGPAKAPAGFRGELRHYQQQGLGWLLQLQTLQVNGCLADDMGLGKTVQVLALLEGRRQAGKGLSLVVLPKSLAFNWQQEVARFAPELRVVSLSGSERPADGEGLPGADLFLISYATLIRDIDWLENVKWDYVILDEAQAIKNAASKTAQAVGRLRAEHRLTLTGTPLENRLEDLWSQMQFLNPGLPLRKLADLHASPASLAVIGKALRPFLFRRTKEQVADDLPEKMEETLLCPLPEAQQALYKELETFYRQKLHSLSEAGGIRKSGVHVLEALLRLRQAACHPGLLDPGHLEMETAKFAALEGLLEDVLSSGHKALIFSQFTQFLGLLRRKLDAQGLAYAYLDGQTRDREAAVNRFQEDPGCPLFLISLKAGGVGLNLTAADYVILLDPWWNPAIEAQAIDRAHRIGQQKQVFAYRIVAQGTVEEKILALQRDKRALADAILTEENQTLSQFDLEDLLKLLG